MAATILGQSAVLARNGRLAARPGGRPLVCQAAAGEKDGFFKSVFKTVTGGRKADSKSLKAALLTKSADVER